MKISVTEALRLKNEISKLVQKLQYNLMSCSLGKTLEDDVEISSRGVSFNEANDALTKILKISEEINNIISKYNRDSGVDNIIRKLHNSKLLFEIYEKQLPNTKPKEHSKWENLGDGERKQVKIKYVPEISGIEMKKLINEQKKIFRDSQKQVESLNMKEIEVSFSYEDLESIITE